MNFDELKKQWDNQSIENISVETDLEKHKKANSIIDNVRKVMKKDFFFQLTSFPTLLAYPFIFEVSTPIMWFVVICYIIIMIVPLSVMYRFYKQSYQLEYNSLKSLNWFYYNYKFSIILFRVYSYITFMLVVMFIGIVFFEKNNVDFESFNLVKVLIVFVGICGFVLLCIWGTNWWIRKFYAKPLVEIKQILDDLEE